LPLYAAGAAAPAAGSCAPALPARQPQCLQNNSELIVVGDSFLNWLTHDFPNDLERALGHSYRMYAEPGASMASGGIATPVPDQLAFAIADDPDMIAAIMTGGGNDILLSDTLQYPGSEECKERADSPSLKVCQDVVAAALDGAQKLIETGAQAGIEDVIYIYYPRIPGALLGIFANSPNEILEYAMPMARALCEGSEAKTNGALRCHFLDLQPIFENHPEWFADDGIHENAAGSAVIARAVVDMMKSRCIAQPASSGCCVR
jgi:lysophospholipase L1-like esterase